MRRSLIARPLIAGAVVAGGMTSGASAMVWSISGASAGTAAPSVTSMVGGVIDTGLQTLPGAGGTGTLTQSGLIAIDAVLLGSPATAVAQGLSFFGFENLQGQRFFGFVWERLSGQGANFSASVTGSNAGVLTNTGLGVGGGTLPPASGDYDYFLFAGLGVGSTVTISGSVALPTGSNTRVSWLTYNGTNWVRSASPVVNATDAFALNSATLIPVPAPVGIAAAGLAAGVLAARRMRKHAAAN